jgi:hypothetical protein
MWRVAIVLLAGCTDTVTYNVTTELSSSGTTSTARLVFEDRLFTSHTETYEVDNYDELRDVAQTVTVRSNDVDYGVILPFAASACGSSEWEHSGALVEINVRYRIYGSNGSWYANTDELDCRDSDGELRTVIDRSDRVDHIGAGVPGAALPSAPGGGFARHAVSSGVSRHPHEPLACHSQVAPL